MTGAGVASWRREILRRALRQASGEIFGLFDSGGSDIAKRKDRYVGEAVEAEYLRKAGRRKGA